MSFLALPEGFARPGRDLTLTTPVGESVKPSNGISFGLHFHGHPQKPGESAETVSPMLVEQGPLPDDALLSEDLLVGPDPDGLVPAPDALVPEITLGEEAIFLPESLSVADGAFQVDPPPAAPAQPADFIVGQPLEFGRSQLRALPPPAGEYRVPPSTGASPPGTPVDSVRAGRAQLVEVERPIRPSLPPLAQTNGQDRPVFAPPRTVTVAVSPPRVGVSPKVDIAGSGTPVGPAKDSSSQANGNPIHQIGQNEAYETSPRSMATSTSALPVLSVVPKTEAHATNPVGVVAPDSPSLSGFVPEGRARSDKVKAPTSAAGELRDVTPLTAKPEPSSPRYTLAASESVTFQEDSEKYSERSGRLRSIEPMLLQSVVSATGNTQVIVNVGPALLAAKPAAGASALIDLEGVTALADLDPPFSLPQTSEARASLHPGAPVLATSAQPLSNQIAQAAIAHSGHKTELVLDPEELGKLTLRMTIDERSITLAVMAERPETLELLRRNIEALSQEFREMGYDDVNFSFGGESQSDGHSDEAHRPSVLMENFEQESLEPEYLNRPSGQGTLDIRL